MTRVGLSDFEVVKAGRTHLKLSNKRLGQLNSQATQMWVSVDGVEGVGKTTLCRKLKEAVPSALVLSEFSNGIIGEALRNAIAIDPHVFSKSESAQSLMFLAEYREKVELEVLPVRRERLVVTDRGLISKRVYQRAVLSSRLDRPSIDQMLDGALVGLPEPDLSVVLHADFATLCRRIQGRGEFRTPTQYSFIENLVSLFRNEAVASPTLAIDASAIRASEVFQLVVQAVPLILDADRTISSTLRLSPRSEP
jgi:thymidylate kinase